MQFVIDVSDNNPHPIDWKAVKADGVAGAYIKATEGTDYVNPHFGDDYFAAIDAGLIVGAYHFWHPEEDWAAQCHWFWNHYGPRAGDLPPMWDAEQNKSGLSWSQLADQLKAICWANVPHYGDFGLYVNRAWRDGLVPFGFPWGRKVWLATGIDDVPLAWGLQFKALSIGGVSAPVDWTAI